MIVAARLPDGPEALNPPAYPLTWPTLPLVAVAGIAVALLPSVAASCRRPSSLRPLRSLRADQDGDEAGDAAESRCAVRRPTRRSRGGGREHHPDRALRPGRLHLSGAERPTLSGIDLVVDEGELCLGGEAPARGSPRSCGPSTDSCPASPAVC
jgi:hypothetical protein